jgi:hypothetical protein
MHYICFGAVRLLKNPPYSIEIGTPSFLSRHCVFTALWSFFSLANFIWLHTRGPNITHWGSVDCRDLLSVLFAYMARVPERITKTPEVNEVAWLIMCMYELNKSVY